MKLNKGGLICGGIYTIYFAVLWGIGYFVSIKAGAVLTALAILPAEFFFAAFAAFLDLRDPPFSPESWMNSVYVYYPVSLVIAYFFGWMLSGLGRVLVRLDGGRLDRLDERILDHFDKDG